MRVILRWHPAIITCSVILLLTIGCDSNSQEETPYPLATGVWGSEEARLEVKEAGGVITFFCAEGDLNEKMRVDQDGSFVIKGTMIAGPVAGAVRPVRYQGLVAGNKMALSITYTDTSEDFGVFELTRGFDSSVAFICRC